MITQRTLFRGILPLTLAAALSAPAQAFQPQRPECIAPAKPGGGFDLTCRIVSTSLEKAGLLDTPMMVSFMPGGIGAVAYNAMNANRRHDENAIVALSSGSALNIAEGKFGHNLTENDARWLASAGADFGAIVVKADAPWHNLQELIEAYQKDPTALVIGAGGTVGSQDWMKAAMLAKGAGVDPKKMRYVSFEGGGEATAALLGGHIQIYPGDVSEMKGQINAGTLRILAVLSPDRLPGDFAKIPTAKEQGYDIEWTIFRGYYMAPGVSDEAYNWWVEKFRKLQQTPEFARIREEKGLYPFDMVGADFDRYVKHKVNEFRDLARDSGLIK